MPQKGLKKSKNKITKNKSECGDALKIQSYS
ncbi:MAG: hypothetical protein ACJA1K_001642 [Cognaticolwellia sp.]|jgi:hypothetical protein